MNDITIKGANLPEELKTKIINILKESERIEKEKKALQEQFLKAMEEQGFKKIETEELVITYIEPTTRESFDSKKFKEENPSIYDEYVKISDVKSSVRMKLK